MATKTEKPMQFRGTFWGHLFERQPPNYHCAPVPILGTGGRLYRAFENCGLCVWGSGLQSLVISADEDADLLDAASWRMSNKLSFDPAWIPVEWGELGCPGWLD